ncbi:MULTISPECIES: ABC transporter permease [Rhodomicrobium]|uniref:ABC transporter permease n=1 Tax=Rhodomicrobium TaxID=1068 RepID=UPI000B4A6279|nr:MULTISPECIES: ABC transporter permease [Rhodomicrobium]
MTRFERLTLTLLWAVAGLAFVAMYGPALLVVTLSFFRIDRQRVDWSSFSFDAYAGLAGNHDIVAALTNTLIVGFSAVTCALLIAVGLAFYMHVESRRGQRFVEFMIFLPFILPAIITGVSLLIAFREAGIERGLLTVIVGHIVIIIAIIYRMVMTRLESLERSQLEASLDLGATKMQTFRYVVVPQLASAMVTSALLAFTLSFDETLVTFFLVGGEMTLPIRLWAMVRVGFTPEINALVAVVLLMTTCLATVGALSLKRLVRIPVHG